MTSPFLLLVLLKSTFWENGNLVQVQVLLQKGGIGGG